MSDSLQIAAFEGGELRLLHPDGSSRETVLALPLGVLLAKVIRVPAENRDDLAGYARPFLQAMSPFPDEELTVGVEVMRETEQGAVVLAVALPEGAADPICEALDAAKLNVTRVDALALGLLRGLWPALGADAARKLVVIKGANGLSLLVIDNGLLVSVRALGETGDLKRDVMLALLEAEDFCGARTLDEIVALGGAETAGLEAFAPVRSVEVGEDAALAGVAERSLEPSTLNALPASWGEVLAETRFKAKLISRLAVAGGVWLLIMGVLFGVPLGYGYLTDRQKAMCREHRRQYEAVKETKAKVELVRKYSDHSRGALEIMKAVSDRLPQGITLLSWNYRRDDGVRVSGEADTAELVYRFKDEMTKLAGGDDAVFSSVELRGPSAGRGGKQKFDLDCLYLTGEEEP